MSFENSSSKRGPRSLAHLVPLAQAEKHSSTKSPPDVTEMGKLLLTFVSHGHALSVLYFIILYYSMFATLMPLQFFSGFQIVLVMSIK
jgi:hypothetical protein